MSFINFLRNIFLIKKQFFSVFVLILIVAAAIFLFINQFREFDFLSGKNISSISAAQNDPSPPKPATSRPCAKQSCGVNNPPVISNASTTVKEGAADSLTDNCYIFNSVDFSWTYSDPNGDSQSAFQIQISSKNDFSLVAYDTGKISGSQTNYSTSTLNAGTYYWQIKVWDSKDAESLWYNVSSPFVVNSVKAVNFSWSPATITVDQPVNFTSISTISISGYSWNFQDANPATSTLPNPTGIKFKSGGTKTVILDITALNGRVCEVKKLVPVGSGGEI